ncbi:DUF418 domain-containing protein [Actinomadura graeca]|uniref:DUF418 domain-containing protein n=1 Tax=Actinomadura graeca TaxID=2750812 RepID=A0ABX8R5U4_9ACTN|nr:DUF418 domain-containing protein [Actinomadura graeca]
MTTPDPPVTVSPHRIAGLDALRGFALFGILITNVIVVSTLLTLVGVGEDALLFDGTADRAVLTVVDVLFLGKFFLLFSFLFGYSFTLQLEAADRAGVAAVPRLLRRCGVLFAIGLVHCLFLWFGDILTLYAMLCLILILLRKVRPLTAALLGGGLLVATSALGLLPDDGSDSDLEFLDFSWAHEAYTGGPLDTLSAQLTLAPHFMGVIWAGQGPQALGMFLLGLAAGKKRLLDGGPGFSAWLVRAQWTGLLAGGPVVVWVIAAASDGGDLPAAGEALQSLTNPLITFAYAATVLRLAGRGERSRLVAVLAPAGRMAATNYIVQSLVFALVYTGYGLALVDRVPPLGVIAIAVVTYVLQLAASAWWLKRHPYGPVEWVMRAVTNAKIPAWRTRT